MTETDRPEPEDPLPGRRLPRAVRQFLDTEASGGIVLLVAALVALVWANSPWRASYASVWHTDVRVDVGRHALEGDLNHWVNDALMAVFFFVVGLEIKREMMQGELRRLKTAAMPVVAALGGMVVPALVFLVVTAGSGQARGWGIPMATDIAFAVGVMALVGNRVPSSLKVFLLTLAIVDDIGAIAVIGLFYSSGIEPQYLLAGAGLVATIMLVKRAGIVWVVPYAVLGTGLWLAVYASGIHATIAGVVLGLLTPATPLARHSVSPAERLAHLLHPWSSFLIVPVFALANAGVAIDADAFDAPGATAVTAGVVLGLVLGKTLGIAGAAWVAARLGIAHLPADATWRMMVAVAAVAGIGFTVSLFIAERAFEVGPVQDAARLGVLAASVLAAVVGWTALRRACPSVTGPS